MTSRDFCFWLQGWLEINAAGMPATPTARAGLFPEPHLNTEQLECVRRHLSLVFKHEIDPSLDISVKHKEALDHLHKGTMDLGGPLIRC
jgi:hypothetical protein